MKKSNKMWEQDFNIIKNQMYANDSLKQIMHIADYQS